MAYIESVIIRDTGGTEADVTAANALKVDGSAVTQPVNVVGGSLSATLALQTDMFQETVTATRYNVVEINYANDAPSSIPLLTVTSTTTGSDSNVTGQALYTTGANTNGGIKAVTNTVVKYRPQSETFCSFTAIWPSGGLADSYQRIGIFDNNDGFFVGYEGVVFGITIRKGGVDTQVAQASWNVDTLTGGVSSKFTRNGVPEAINFALDNLYRIRFGWLGAAPVIWEVFSPDGQWVLFHIERYPNTSTTPTLTNPDLPITLDLKKNGAGATVLDMNTACWAGGTSSPYRRITSDIDDDTLASLTRSVIAGRASTGGGTYYNVKVTPSGALVTAPPNIFTEDDPHNSGDSGAFMLGIRNDDQSTTFTNNNGDYSGIAVDEMGRIATVGGQSVNLPHVGGAQTMGAVDNGSGNVLVTNIYDLPNNDALVVGLADGNGDLIPADKLASTAPEHIEDDTHSTGDTGIFMLAVRNDANGVVTNADRDYSQISVNDKGAVAIQDGGNSITVDGTVGVSGTVTVSGTVAATQSGTWNINNVSGTVSLPTGAATETTLSSLNTKFTAVTRTPSLIRATGSGTVAAGARSISVYNAGSAAGSILGVAANILPGEAFDFSAGGEDDTLSAFAYDGTGTTLVITTIV